GSLLGLNEPWERIAERLADKPSALQSRVDAIAERRNDIVHRADRPRLAPDGERQDIHLSWTHSHVHTIRNVLMALDELVEQQMREYEALAQASGEGRVDLAVPVG